MINIKNGADVDAVYDKHILIQPIQTDVSLASAPTGQSAALVAGGSLTDDTYYYKVSAVKFGVETDLSAEVNATTSGANNSIKISWTPVTYAEKYYIYKSLASGEYHEAFEVQSGSNFVDDGNREIFLKEPPVAVTHTNVYSSIRKDLIENVIGDFIAANEFQPARAIVTIEAECEYRFDLSEISNQPTWVTTEAGVDVAVKDILGWI